MRDKLREIEEIHPQDISSILDMLKTREEETIFMIDICFHSRNLKLRSNPESINIVHQLLLRKEQARFSREERILNKSITQQVRSEAGKKQLIQFFDGILQINAITRKKLFELDLLEETKETLLTFPKTEEAIQTFVLCRAFQLSSIYNFFIKTSRKRHESQFKKVSQLKKLTENSPLNQANQGLETTFQIKIFESATPATFRTTLGRFGKDGKEVTANDSGLVASGERKTIHNQANNRIALRRNTQPGSECLESLNSEIGNEKNKQEPESNLLIKRGEHAWFYSKRSSFDDCKFRNTTMSVSKPINEGVVDALGSESSITTEDPTQIQKYCGGLNLEQPSKYSTACNFNKVEKTPKGFRESKFVFPSVYQRRQSLNMDSPTSPTKRLSKLTSILQLEPRYLILSAKPEVRKNQMEKIYQELLEANTCVQSIRSQYYQKYMESKATKEKKTKTNPEIERDSKKPSRIPQTNIKSAFEAPKDTTEKQIIGNPSEKPSEPISKAYQHTRLLINKKDYTQLIKQQAKDHSEDSGPSHRDDSTPVTKVSITLGVKDQKNTMSDFDQNLIPKYLNHLGLSPKLPSVTAKKQNLGKDVLLQKHARNNTFWTPVREGRASSLRTTVEDFSDEKVFSSGNQPRNNSSFQGPDQIKQITFDQAAENSQMKPLTINKFLKYMNECDHDQSAEKRKCSKGQNVYISVYPRFTNQKIFDRMRLNVDADKQDAMPSEAKKALVTIFPVAYSQETSFFNRTFIKLD